MKAAIEVFNEANKEHVLWEPNMKRALLLPPLAGRAAGAGGVGENLPATEATDNDRIQRPPVENLSDSELASPGGSLQ